MAQIHSRHSTAGLEPDAHGACYAAWPHIEELQQQSRKRLFQDELARVGSPWLKWMIDASGGWKWLSGFQGAKYADSSGTKTRVAPRGGGIVPCRQPATAWKLSAKKNTCQRRNSIFQQILLPAAASSKTASKKSPPGRKTQCLWRTSRFQNHAKKNPNVSSEILDKQHFSTDSVACGC